MTTSVLDHDTIRLERCYPHLPSKVFAAYADIDRRALWSAPSPQEDVIFDTHNFRVGGIDEFRCGLKGQLQFAGVTRYEQIVPDELIIYTERLVATDGALQAVSLVTWSITSEPGGSRLMIIDQVASVTGDGIITGSRDGYAAMLDQLADHLDHHP